MEPRGYIPLNGLATICAAGYVGYVASPSYMPWGGIVATAIFLIAAVYPIIREYQQLNIGFKEIEKTYLENRQREHSPPTQEILSPTASAAIKNTKPKSGAFAYALSIVAIFLLIIDITYWRMIDI